MLCRRWRTTVSMEVVGGAASEAEHQIFGRRRRGGGKHLRDRRIRHAREEREGGKRGEGGRQPTERRAWRHRASEGGSEVRLKRLPAKF